MISKDMFRLRRKYWLTAEERTKTGLDFKNYSYEGVIKKRGKIGKTLSLTLRNMYLCRSKVANIVHLGL